MSPIRSLDYDSAFLSRFDADEICDDVVTFLHVSRRSDWDSIWNDKSNPDLWRYNLHYFEYLLPLAKAYEDTGDSRYLDKAKGIIVAWITGNAQPDGGDGWSPYTVALRLINWGEWLALTDQEAFEDEAFRMLMVASYVEQHCFLATHLEKDLLANHYLEDLKTLVVSSLVLDDSRSYRIALDLLEKQVEEQVLPDGMHFELSPLYHKIMFESLIRVAWALKEHGKESSTINKALKRMADFLYSFERDTDTTPLFNDSGDNIAKSKSSLLATAKELLGIEPTYKSAFSDSGYYLFETETDGHTVKVIIDAGKTGPDYATGHAHCDMLSYECYVDGAPRVVNAGTYEYAPGENRRYYRSTAAHNTVMVNGGEQSQCWAQFRLARRASPAVQEHDADRRHLKASCTDYRGRKVVRQLDLDSSGRLRVLDHAEDGQSMVSFIHAAPNGPDIIVEEGALSKATFAYAPEYGAAQQLQSYSITAENSRVLYYIDCLGKR
jgi:uncharacterized heparinase superfamily protein